MSNTSKYDKLLEPCQIGPVKTRNRMVKTGASMCYWHEDNLHMPEKAKAFYGALAKGGVGLLIIESPDIDYPLGARWHERYRMDDDKFIQGMSELVEAIHVHGCPTFMQMWHDGPWQNPLFPNYPPTYEGPPIGASPVNVNSMGDFHRDIPRVLTVAEIEEITEKFAAAAVRAQKAGFDGIEINAASSHLMHNFLSPYWNRRDDEYGGSLENRTRFLVNIIREIKKRAGGDFPVSIILNGIEIGRTIGVEDSQCLTNEIAFQTAVAIEAAGADAIHIRNHWLGYHVGGFFPDYLFFPEPPIPVQEFPKEYNTSRRGAGANLYLAEGLKKTVSIPIIIVGKIDYKLGDRIIREGKADFIGMTRALQADPEMPNKLASGHPEDIAPCTACGTCLDQSQSMARHCRINAAMGTEKYNVEPATERKKVAVVGGGPAGLEVARVAALRGHQVTLYEKSSRLGGLLPLAALIKGLEIENLPDMIRYFEVQLDKLGVRKELNREFTAATARETRPDVVVIATGGTLTVPEITGIDKPNVLTTTSLHRRVKPFLRMFGPRLLGWLTRIWLPVGKKVIVIGGGLHGCETAEFLIKRGREVTIVEESDAIGEGMLDFRLGLTLDWFGRKGINIITGVRDMEITDKGLVITNREGRQEVLEADSILPTSPLTPNTGLYQSLQGKVPELHAIGDCSEPRMIVDAIADGWRVGQAI